MATSAPIEPSVSNRAVKGVAWLIGIIGVFGVAILLAWLVGMNNPPLSNRSTERQEIVMRATPEQPAASPTLQSPAASAQFVAILVPSSIQTASLKGSTDATKALSANPQPAALTAQSSAADNSSAATQAYNDRIEQEALEVIHGDFGNNPGRKDKLGSDYAAVQARVNQLMHI